MAAKNVRTFELKLGKRALIVFVLGISGLLFVTFHLGVKVGTLMDAYPEKVSMGISYVIMEYFGYSPKKAETATAVAEAPKDSAAKVEESLDMTFFDTLSKKKKEETIEEKNDPAGVAAVVPGGAPPQEKPGETRPQENASAPVVNERAPVKTPPATSRYLIQVISLREKKKADEVRKKLVGLGYSPRIVMVELEGRGTWHRVVLEGFESQEKAQKAKKRISEAIRGVTCVIHAQGE
jgi:cell division protein FtsN